MGIIRKSWLFLLAAKQVTISELHFKSESAAYVCVCTVLQILVLYNSDEFLLPQSPPYNFSRIFAAISANSS